MINPTGNMRVEDGFQPVPFPEDNPYTSDPVLPSLLKRTLPESAFEEIEPDLKRLGEDVITTIRAMGSGSRVAPPRLTQYDQWGRRIDELETSEGWRDLKAVGQKEGLPGIFYERKYQEHSRSYGFAKMMLMVGDVHVVFCPLSMTDGTARVIELLGSAEMKEKILPRLISRDPAFAFTSGQWMTEVRFLCIDLDPLAYALIATRRLRRLPDRNCGYICGTEQCFWSPIYPQRFQVVLQCYRQPYISSVGANRIFEGRISRTVTFPRTPPPSDASRSLRPRTLRHEQQHLCSSPQEQDWNTDCADGRVISRILRGISHRWLEPRCQEYSTSSQHNASLVGHLLSRWTAEMPRDCDSVCQGPHYQWRH
ncbi:hypothetical protein FPV67DRAFT_761537 [Lyophyllum atratum]|nr:hypothetical protein FPV67DRAFT_761537 [Lyophyllum atratum]